MKTFRGRIGKALRPTATSSEIVWTPGRRLLLAVGSCAYIGLLPASGTISVALVGIPAYLLLSRLSFLWYLVIAVLFTGAAVWVHDYGDRLLGEKDSGKLVFDEIAGFLIAMIALPTTWQVVGLAFLIQRALDIAKPWPANVIEDRMPGGWGVVFDDVFAGVYACGAMHLLCYLVPSWLTPGAS